MPSNSILIIDDDPDVLDALKLLLEDDFKTIASGNNPNRIRARSLESFDVILLDMNFSAGINSGNEGLFWLSKILEANNDSAVVVMTAYGNIGLAVEAIKRGAKDFILKPWENDKLVATLMAVIAQNKSGSKKNTATHNPNTDRPFIAGRSKVIENLQLQVNKIAPTDASILIVGENGTGKDVLARELHRLSSRAQHPFISVDMSALTPTLFESELFGHTKGSFTDARTDRKGRFEIANGGTLFLDEIGNIELVQQAKLLTVLQNREIIPVGSNNRIPINVRLITATNVSLEARVDQGLFRQDLLYRINTITLNVPPLRERGDDILVLAEYFLEMYCKQYQRDLLSLHSNAKTALLNYMWPGNVRELQHSLEKAVILSNGPEISAADLNLSISSKPTSPNKVTTLDDMEKEALRHALRSHSGNIVHAAKALGITRQTLYNKMKKYGI